MKTKKLFWIILLYPFFFSCGDDGNLYDYDSVDPDYYGSFIDMAECTNVPRPADTYVYPVVPGTDEWKELHNKGMEEVKKACRVPDDVLQNQSTQAVIQTFFDHPYCIDGLYTSSSTELNGFMRSVEGNSIYSELLKRKDAGKCLLKRYLPYNPVGCGTIDLQFTVFEMLIAQSEFYSQLSADEKKMLVKEALRKHLIIVAFDPESGYRNHTTFML
ncbi:MAG: hypothetical protein LBJ39_04690, partial [Tannerellaceae bacterium]|nr:hypothetical protein [Tannerellaceae bacterium]